MVLGIVLPDETALLAWAATFARRLSPGDLVFLKGELGAGKTTLVRGVLRSWGFAGAVKSPTYTLLEPYVIDGRDVYHFDFYRVGAAQELDFIGIDELMAATAIKFVEWPDAFEERLPAPDYELRLTPAGAGRRLELVVRT